MFKESNKVWSYTETADTWTEENPVWIHQTAITSFSARDWKSGIGLPNWRAIIKQGGNATTVFTGERYTLGSFSPYSTFLIRKKGNPADINNPLRVSAHNISANRVYFPGFGSVGTLDDVTANNQALTKLYNAVRENRTRFQGQIFLGEAREAMRMLISPAKALRQGIADYISSVSKRTAKAPRKAKKQIIAETWLEYSFGWIPLIHDLDDAHKAYYSLTSKMTTSRITRQGKERTVYIDFTNMLYGFAPNIAGRLDGKTVGEVTVRYIIGMRNANSGAAPNSAFEKFGFTIGQFVPTLYELTPWSFLFDYFTNIGDMINAGCTNTSDVLWVCRTIRKEAIKSVTIRIDNAEMLVAYGPHASWGGNPGTFETKFTSIQRSPLGTIPFPRFEVSVPSSPTKWINMAALGLAQKRLISSF